MSENSVAIIGMALRVPHAETIADFWDLLLGEKDCLTRLGNEQIRTTAHEKFVPVRGALQNVRGFDAQFFGIRPSEAKLIDPQHRIFLECAWEALEAAGHLSSRDRARVGVFASAGFSTYLSENVNPSREELKDSERLEILMANDKDFLAARVAYKLGLTGPALSVQAACASSLAAIHVACQSIVLGECDMALAGGVSIDTSRSDGYFFEPGLTFSSCGMVRSFDRDADGTVPSAGAGVVALKRLDDAIRDGDSIYAVILGSSITNDGSMRPALSTPTQEGIERAVRDAIAIAETDTSEIGYIEGHGSGTMLGDRIEARALLNVFKSRAHGEPCLIGSLKSNVGHLDVASGVVGLIKATLSIHRKFIPRSIHCRHPLEEFARADACIRVAQTARAWTDDQFGVRKATVNSMGLGGHNVHAVLSQAPQRKRSAPNKKAKLLIWSAQQVAAADSYGVRLAKYLEESTESNLSDISYSLAACRPEFPIRRAMMVDPSRPAIVQSGSSVLTGRVPTSRRKTVGVFSAPGAGRHFDLERMQSCPTFTSVVEKCLQVVREELGALVADRLRTLLADRSPSGSVDTSAHSLADRHSAFYILAIATAKQHVAWGLHFDAWSGNGLGETCAAAMSGIFSIEDGLRLVRARAECATDNTSQSGFLLVDSDVVTVRNSFGLATCLEVDGGSQRCVVSGRLQEIQALAHTLQERGLSSRMVMDDWGLHTPLEEPAAVRLRNTVNSVCFLSANKRFDSASLGTTDASSHASLPNYWCAALADPIRYLRLLKDQAQSGSHLFVEFGIADEFTGVVRECLADQSADAERSSMYCTLQDGVITDATLLLDFGKLWLNGAQVDWRAHFESESVRREWLPNYAFQRQDYWTDRKKVGRTDSADSSTYVVTWKPLTSSIRANEVESLLVDLTDKSIAGKLSHGTDDQEPSFRSSLSLDLAEVLYGDFESLVRAVCRVSAILTGRVVVRCKLDSYHPGAVSKATEIAAALSILGRALGKTSASSVTIVVDRAFIVRREDIGHPLGEMIAACALVLDQEIDRVRWSFVDVCDHWNQLSECLRYIPTSGVYVLRDGKLYGRELQSFVPPACPPPMLKPGATYLITGGAGKIGRALAQYLIERYQAKIIVVGRSAQSAARDRSSETARSHKEGGLTYVSADICDVEGLSIALEGSSVDVGAVRGVFHLASITSEAALIEGISGQDIHRQFAAKCQGIVSLNRLFEKSAPDFLVLFSSTSSILGGLGLYAYSAACALADGLSSWAVRQGLPWSTFNWDGWNTERSALSKGFALHDYFFETDSALELLDRLLVRGQNSQVVCMRGDFHQRSADARRSRREAPAVSELSLSTSVFKARSSGLVERIVDLWTSMMGRSVSPDSEFFEVGGDSLLAVRIANCIQKEWGVRVPITLFMEQTTPRKLATFVSGSRTDEATSATKPSPALNRFPQRDVLDRATPISLADLTPNLNRLSRLFMARACQVLRDETQVAPEFVRLFRLFRQNATSSGLHILSEREVFNETEKAAELARGMALSTPYERLVRGFISLGQQIEKVMRGEASAVAILFEGGDDSMVSIAYRKMPEAVRMLDCLTALASQLKAEDPKRQLRILELGGGIGVATERLFPLFSGSGYVFSDISAGFFHPIRERFPAMQCRTLDLNSLCHGESFDSNERFDLVIAVNALHCAKSIQDTLCDARRLLNSDGAMLVVEATRNEPWHLLGLGPLKGFLDFIDFRSNLLGPFVDLAHWRKLLSKAKFELVVEESTLEEFERIGQIAFIARCRE